MKNKYFETPVLLKSSFSDNNGNSYNSANLGTQGIFALIPGLSNNKGDRKTPNAWSYNLYEYKTQPSHYQEIYNDGSYSYTSNQDVRLLLTPDLQMDAALYQAEGKALDKLVNMLRGDLDVSVDAFQARQTAKMFSLSDQFKNMFMRRINRLNKAGSYWLQYVYGWKPLASSIYGTVQESMRFANNHVQNFKASGNVTVDSSTKGELVIGNASFPGQFNWKGNARVLYGCQYLLDDGTSAARFSSLNPASIAWELLPWSFVIDWAFNVGSYLRQVETALLYGSNFRSGYKSTTIAVTVSYSGGGVKTSPPYVRSGQASGSYRNISFSREILNGTPYPRPPRVDLEMGSGRLLNAAALLSQFIKSKPMPTRGPRQRGD